MSASSRALRNTTLALAMAAGMMLAGLNDASAGRGGFRGGFHGGHGGHGGQMGFRHGGRGFHHGGHGFRHARFNHGHGGCWGCGAFAGGLALGALASWPYGYGYGYGAPYNAAYYDNCALERQIWRGRVRYVRVCY